MKAQLFTANQHAELFEAWWTRWSGKPLLKRLQSQYGVFVHEGGQVLAISYLYPTIGSEMIYLGFTVRDPDLEPIRSDQALKLLLLEVEHASRTLGYSIIQTTFESQAMRARVQDSGYLACGETQIFVKDLNNNGTRY